VRYQPDRGRHLLKANCDGVVVVHFSTIFEGFRLIIFSIKVITREKCQVDTTIPVVKEAYEYRNYENLEKLTFNVIPRKMSNTFRLVEEV
jgi:hypothetical protein